MVQTRFILVGITGHGWFNSTILMILKKHNYNCCLGSVYPFDAHIRNVRMNETHIMKRTRAGSIIIIHDREWTIELLENILPRLKQRGLEICTVTQLVDYNRWQSLS